VSCSERASVPDGCEMISSVSVGVRMGSSFEFAASAIVMLLVTIGPLETAAIFGLLTSGARRRARRRLAAEAVAIGGGVLVVFAIGGPGFLGLLHVSVPAFQVAAGILLLLQSIQLIFAHPSGLSALTASEEKEAKGTSEIAVFPLAIPLIAGPASITAAMLLMGQAGTDLVKVAVFFLALLLALALTWAALVLVDPLGRLLGVTGTNVIARISGILLSALAVQFIFDGIRESHLLR
jgi:multiple antibiotic resistance protein